LRRAFVVSCAGSRAGSCADWNTCVCLSARMLDCARSSTRELLQKDSSQALNLVYVCLFTCYSKRAYVPARLRPQHGCIHIRANHTRSYLPTMLTLFSATRDRRESPSETVVGRTLGVPRCTGAHKSPPRRRSALAQRVEGDGRRRK
jgi:hypothetical protein